MEKVNNLKITETLNTGNSYTVNPEKSATITGKPSIDRPHLRWYPEESYTRETPKMTAYEYMKQRNKGYNNDMVFKYFGKKITYREFFEKIEEAKKAFVKLGVTEGDIVTIMSVNSPELIYSFYALNALNAIPNMIDPRTTSVGVNKYLKEVNSKYLLMLNLCQGVVKESLEGTNIKKVVVMSPNDSLPLGLKQLKGMKDYLWSYTFSYLKIVFHSLFISWNDFMKQGRVITNVPHPTYIEDFPACIVHTGGTTGDPKGVMLTNENLNAMVEGLDYAHVDLKRHRKFLNVLVPFVAYGAVNGIHTAVCKGWESTIIPKLDQGKFAELILKEKPEICLGVPAYFDAVMENSEIQDKNLNYGISYIVGGDGMKQEKEFELDRFMLDHYGRAIKKGYGLTECAACATVSSDIVNNIGSVGLPLPKNLIAAFDPETGEEKSYGELGELAISGPTVMLGYYNNEEATNDMLRKHDDGRIWLHTGDIGYVAEDGQVYHKDRMKRMIIRSGYKVFPSVLENTVSMNDCIQSCSAIGIPSEQEGTAPVVVAVLEEKYRNRGMEETVKQNLDILIQEQLPDYMYPADIVFRDSMPLTSVGKIDYMTLQKEYIDKKGIITEKAKVFSK